MAISRKGTILNPTQDTFVLAWSKKIKNFQKIPIKRARRLFTLRKQFEKHGGFTQYEKENPGNTSCSIDGSGSCGRTYRLQ